MKDRSRARTLASEFAARGDHLGWFEAFYRESAGNSASIPWADLAPNAHLVEWRRRTQVEFRGLRCVTVGCGLGDDAEYLASAGARVVAFDISETAIEWCRRRFPDSGVTYVASDLFNLPADWKEHFDFVLECNTLQVLPAELRREAMRCLAALVAPNGWLLVICRARQESEPEGELPWPLTRRELDAFTSFELPEISFEEYLDAATPPVRRFRVLYGRPLQGMV